MSKQQLTIKDIARALGVSISTVSRALNNNPDISKETRDRINEYAQAHQYIPNTMASHFRTNKSMMIGVIVPQIVHHFFSRVLSGMEEAAFESGYQIVVAQSNESYQRESEIAKSFLNARVCGVIASLAKETAEYSHYQTLLNNGIPIVFYDRICTEVSTERVVIDDYAGAFSAVEYMIKTGCKRIVLYSSPLHLEISKNRRNGYLDAMHKYGIQTDDSMIQFCDTREKALEITPEILSQPNRPDGFFSINDETAAGIMQACKQQGLKIPEDVSICGFSNGDIAENTDPKLTTVEQCGEEIGASAVRLLIHKIEHNLEKTGNRIVRTKLVVRGSTRQIL